MGASMIIGIDGVQERRELAMKLGLADLVLDAGANNVADVRKATEGMGCERAIDCSGNDKARLTCIQATRKWGKICFIGEGGTVAFQPSPDIIHDQKTIYGSWVTSIWKMEELVERIVRWKIHPEDLVTHRFPPRKSRRGHIPLWPAAVAEKSPSFSTKSSSRQADHR